MDKADVVRVLLANGVDVSVISDAVDLPPETVYRLKRNESIDVDPSSDLVEAMQGLGWKAYEVASFYLREGSPAIRMQIIRMMMAMMARRVGSQTPKETARLVNEFRHIIEIEDSDDDDADVDESDVDEDMEVAQ